jgi:hypothetical protein
VDDVVATPREIVEVLPHVVDKTLELIDRRERTLVPHPGERRVLVNVLGVWKNNELRIQSNV